MRGVPKQFTPVGRAGLTGRPKKSRDVERVCPICGAAFTVPEWNSKTYCSLPCSFDARKGRELPRKPHVSKICPVCGTAFEVYPSQAYIVCCSKRCAGLKKRNASPEKARQMSQAQTAWLAGLFDGEGSVIINHRKLTSPSYRITITNTCKPLVDKIVEVTGITRVNVRNPSNPRHATTYVWECGGSDALFLLRQMRPWLLVKAERADAAFEGLMFERQSRWDDVRPVM